MTRSQEAALTLLAVATICTGCSAESRAHDSGVTRVCEPGRSVACIGTGGCAGGQECLADGTGYGLCACGSEIDASGADAASDVDAATTCDCIDADPEDCVEAVCIGTTCSDSPLPYGTGCRGGNCSGGACCFGCRSPDGCFSGDIVTACGGYGAVCQNCEDGNPCTIDECRPPGICAARTNAPGGTPCPGGLCSGGTCVVTSDAGTAPACPPGTTRRASGCVPCGGEAQACCIEGPPGDLCTAAGTYCRGDLDRCIACGERSEPCCNATGPDTSSCASGLACNTMASPPVCDCGYHFGPCCGTGGCDPEAGSCRCEPGGVRCTCRFGSE